MATYTTRVLDRLETGLPWALALLALDVALLTYVLYLLRGV